MCKWVHLVSGGSANEKILFFLLMMFLIIYFAGAEAEDGPGFTL